MKAIARGHVWFEQLASGEAATIADIARRENVTDRYVSALLKLAFLSPELVQAALEGREPPRLSAKRLTLEVELPLLWSEQRDVLADVSRGASGEAPAGSINGYHQGSEP
jgi:ParB-like chromosome segregation protein Spo0J